MSVPDGFSAFPLVAPTQPIPAEFLMDTVVQLLEIINQQCVPSALTADNGGTFTANGATAVTVAAPQITANSQVLITLKTVGGTVGAIPHLATITPGTGFTVVGTASDTSVYNYAIIG